MQTTTPQISSTLSFLIFLFLSLHLPFPSTGAELCNPEDKSILLQLRTYFGDDDSAFSDWDPEKTDCCDGWTGIKCNADGRVTSLHLNLLSETRHQIPPTLGDLPFLESLTLHKYGNLYGSIPDAIGKLTHLQNLNLAGNSLTGSIPESLGQLPGLTSLSLAFNSLSGKIPASLGQLTGLTTLDLSSNKLTGPIPDTLGQLTSLVKLDLSSNRLSGRIPASLSNLNKLTLLDLRSNRHSGSIPDTFGSFKNPELQLFLSDNRLTGTIPPSLGDANVKLLSLSMNKLRGDASFLFNKDKTALETLYIDDNQLKFDFSEVEFPKGLKNLDISNNQIFGSLPKQLGQLTLRFLDVSYNQLCGAIPTSKKLKKFTPAIFSNNECLCGTPLPACK